MVVQWGKDPALSLQWPRSLLWYGFDPWPQECPHAVGTANNKKNGVTKLSSNSTSVIHPSMKKKKSLLYLFLLFNHTTTTLIAFFFLLSLKNILIKQDSTALMG